MINKYKSPAAIVCALLACAGLSACATGPRVPTAQQYEMGRMRQVLPAKVESVRSVHVPGRGSLLGEVTGAAVGGVLGSAVGAGAGQRVGAVLGAVAGGVAGHNIEAQASSDTAIELVLLMDDGSRRLVVQPDEGTSFVPGQDVNLVMGNPFRVIPAQPREPSAKQPSDRRH